MITVVTFLRKRVLQMHLTNGTLIESEAHTHRDVLKVSCASLNHIITWNLMCTNTRTMQSSTSKVRWVSAAENAMTVHSISCTVCGDLLTYQNSILLGQVRSPGGRPGDLKSKKIDPKQLPRIQPKFNVTTSLIAQEIR